MNSSIFYKTAAERERLVQAEREHTTARVKKIIEFKRQVCDGSNKGFVIINQKVRKCSISSSWSLSSSLHFTLLSSSHFTVCWPKASG